MHKYDTVCKTSINQQQASSYRAERKNDNITQHKDKYKNNTMNNAETSAIQPKNDSLRVHKRMCTLLLGAQHMTTTVQLYTLSVHLLYQKSLYCSIMHYNDNFISVKKLVLLLLLATVQPAIFLCGLDWFPQKSFSKNSIAEVDFLKVKALKVGYLVYMTTWSPAALYIQWSGSWLASTKLAVHDLESKLQPIDYDDLTITLPSHCFYRPDALRNKYWDQQRQLYSHSNTEEKVFCSIGSSPYTSTIFNEWNDRQYMCRIH